MRKYRKPFPVMKGHHGQETISCRINKVIYNNYLSGDNTLKNGLNEVNHHIRRRSLYLRYKNPQRIKLTAEG